MKIQIPKNKYSFNYEGWDNKIGAQVDGQVIIVAKTEADMVYLTQLFVKHNPLDYKIGGVSIREIVGSM